MSAAKETDGSVPLNLGMPSHRTSSDDLPSSPSAASETEKVAEPAQDEVLTKQPSKRLEDQEKERSRGKIALIMAALMMAVFLAAIDITIVTTALPTIAEHFNSTAAYTWTGSGYLLAAAAATPIWGKVSDIFGRKPTLLLANIIFFIGSLICALSINVGMLIVARVIQGAGGGGLIVLVNICIGDLFSPRRRGAYYGFVGGVWAIASSLGPIVGGAFTEYVTWRWCFYINLPLDGIAFIILLFFLDLETPRTPLVAGLKAVDWLGVLLVIGGTVMFLLGLEYGGDSFPWDSATVICLIVFGVVCFVLFFIVQWKVAKYPVMPLRIFKHRTNLAALGVCWFHGFVFIGGSFYLPLYFQAARGASPLLSGVYILPTSVALSVGSIVTGIFIRKVGLYLPPIYLGLLFQVLGNGLFIDFARDSSWAKIIIFQIIAGLGAGPNFQAPLIALQSNTNPRDIGTATATFAFVRNISTSVSVVIGNVVFQNSMAGKAGTLSRAVGPRLAAQLSGGAAGAESQVIDALPPGPKLVVQTAFADSLMPMWILYTSFAAAGLVTGLFITKQTLSRDHKETKTGLAAEEENRQQNLKEKEEKDALKGEKRRTADEEKRRKSAGGVPQDKEEA